MNPEKTPEPLSLEKEAHDLSDEMHGDFHFNRQEFEKALEYYQKAVQKNENNSQLYDKMVEAKSLVEGEWSEKDFIESLEWTMQRQAIENPEVKEVHERLSPTYQQIKALITQLLTTINPERKNNLVKQIQAFQTQALLPLLDTLLSLQSLAQENLENQNP